MTEASTAIVTGASGGIGAAIAKAMLEQGYRVVSLALEKPDWSHKHLESRAVDLLDAKATDAVAAVIWAALNGITLQKLINPEFDADQAIDALWEMIAAFVDAHSRAAAARHR